MARTRIMTTEVNGKRVIVEHNKTFDAGLWKQHVGMCVKAYHQTTEEATRYAQTRKATKSEKAMVEHNKFIMSQIPS